MPKYNVKLSETVSYDVEVEAESGKAAEEAAMELWANSQDPFNDFCGYGQGCAPLYHEILREDGTVIHQGDPDDPEKETNADTQRTETPSKVAQQ